MAGFDVVLGDLRAMANTFHTESDTYRELSTKVSPPLADTGDGSLNGVLKAVLETLAVLHAQMATSIDEHGHKLAAARDSYARREIDNRALFDDLATDE